MADANIKINIETQSLDQLNAKLATLQAEIKKVPVGSAEFKKLSGEIRKVDGAVEGANKKLKALDVGQLAGNFAKVGASVASASALFKQFGQEGTDSNKEIQQALEATNTILGAAAIAEGVAAAGEVAFAIATEGATIAQEAFAVVVGTSTGALKALRIALVSTGIGALIVGLGLLITYMMDAATATEVNKKSLEALNVATEENIKNIDKLNTYNQNAAKKAEAQAIKDKKSIKEISEIRQAAIIKDRNASIARFDEIREQNAREVDEATKGLKVKFNAYNLFNKVVSDGYASLTKDEQAFYDKSNVIVKKGLDAQKVFFIEQDNFQTQLDTERINLQKEQQDKADEIAQKRRDKLKADLNEITDILKEQNVAFSLQTIQADYQRITGILDKLKGQTTDFKGVLKELTTEGFGPLAKVLEKTFGKEGKANLTEIKKAVEEAFSKERLSNIQTVLDEVSAKLEETVGRSNASIDELVAGFTQDQVGQFIKVKNEIATLGDEVATDTVQIAFSLEEALSEINLSANNNLSNLQKNAADQINLVKSLVAANLLSPAEADKLFAKINEAYDKGVKSIQEKTKNSTQSLITSIISANQKTVQDNLTRLGNQLTEAETKLINESLGKSTIKKLKLEKDYQEEKYSITQAGLLSEKLQNENAQAQLEGLKKQGLITEEQYTTEKEKLTKQGTQVVLKNERAIADERNRRLQESLVLVEAYLEEVKKYYAVIAQGVQAIGNIIADQATLNDIRLQEEIETVNLLYDQRFALIDAEEKKLDDLAASKEKNLTKEERKRRQLSSERASLEAQQQQELAQLENERANAAADAAIKQANVNFALAVGQISIATAEAIIKAVAASPVTFGLPFSAFAAGAGALQLAAAESARSAAIATAEASRPRSVSLGGGGRVSKAEGGLITGPGNGISDSIPANLSNGEFVVNANATQKFLPLLSALNSSGLQGGNPVNPSGGNNEMVALLQDIKSKLSEPNRSYVVASDLENIQNKQNYINRRSNAL